MFGETLQIMASLLANPTYWLVLITVVVIAEPLGLIPGVGGLTVIAIALPFLILRVDPLWGLIFVAGLLSLGNTLDAVQAVVLGIPGAGNQVTYLEGHQIARRGQAARLLGAIFTVSTIGGLIGAITMAFAMPSIRPLIVRFSYPEITTMVLFGVLMVAVLARGAALKAAGAACLGLLAATIGISGHSAIARFTHGEVYLFDGLPLIPVLLGIFALPELIDLASSRAPVAVNPVISRREVFLGALEGLKRWKTIPRQSIWGVFLGAVPGIGQAVIDWLAYALGVLLSKDKSQFGKGSMDGVLFAESAQSAKEAGQAIPTLAFGIPGGSGWALCVAAMIAYGIAPGLSMLDQHLDITMGIVLTIGLGNMIAAVIAFSMAGPLARLANIPYPLVAGALIPLMFLSAFQASYSWGDISVLLLFGAIGLAMKWFGWPRPPFILLFILGPILEDNLWTALQMRPGPLIFLTRPFALGILLSGIVGAALLVWSFSRGATTIAREPAGARSVGAMAAGPVPARAWRIQFVKPRWRWEFVFWLVLLGYIGGVIFRESLSRQGVTKFMPLWASISFFVIIAVMATLEVTRVRREQGAGMDLGMRTGTDVQAFRSVIGMIGWVAGLVLLVSLLGLQIAALVFAAVFIWFNAPLRGARRLWTLVPLAFIALAVFGVFENLIHPIWPSPFVRNWLLDLF